MFPDLGYLNDFQPISYGGHFVFQNAAKNFRGQRSNSSIGKDSQDIASNQLFSHWKALGVMTREIKGLIGSLYLILNM